jgi:3-oxoacyl-[acyl-carrier-protein] synthase II
MKRQPVITGLGIVSPIGLGVESFWKSAVAGRSGIGSPTLFDPSDLPPECRMVGEVRDFSSCDGMFSQATRKAGRFSRFAVAASKMAIEDGRLVVDAVAPERLKISIGTSLNGQADIGQANFQSYMRGEDIWPGTSNEFPAHAASSHVAIATGSRAQTMTFATACAAGVDAIAWGAREVMFNEATAVIAGATETPLSAFILQVFRSVGVLAQWNREPETASRPYDRLRSGLVLAEGAGIVTIENEQDAHERGADVYARVLGWASVTEGRHLRKVDETGESVARAFLAALDQAQLSPNDIDYICAHGNSMPDYDVAETAGIKRVFGRRSWNIPISSIKSMCGQALAASSAIQVVASCLVLRHQILPPTINYEFPDPKCDLDYVPNLARVARVRTILIHAHSLGGAHVAMILGTAT